MKRYALASKRARLVRLMLEIASLDRDEYERLFAEIKAAGRRVRQEAVH
jgi:hypothetical protein